MNRTERLLSLIASLIDAKEPVSADVIRGWFPEDYDQVSPEAFERKFERDKADIVELGIPLRYVKGDEEAGDGYVVSAEEAYLPAIDFEPEELAILHLAGEGVLSQREFPYHRDLERALHKIALATEPDRVAAARSDARRVMLNHPVQPDDPRLGRLLEQASEALTARKRLGLVYHALYSGEVSKRTVDPYGLRCWRGRWAIVGYCHERDDIRLFSLHRIRELRLASEQAEEPDFEVPEDFSLAEWQMKPSWRFRVHEPVTACVEIADDRAWLVEQQLGAEARDGADGWRRFDVEVTHMDGFVEWALRQGPALRVLSPDELRDKVADALRGVLACYQEERA